MDVRVFGQKELIDRIEQGLESGSHLISIGNPGKGVRGNGEDSRLPEIFRDRYDSILRLEFFDVEYKRYLRHIRPKRIPRKSDVRKVIRYFKKTAGDATGYTIHCWQGISRSTAIALCLLYLIHGEEDVAVRELMRIRPEAVPHSRIIEYFDRISGSRLTESIAPVRERKNEELKRWFFAEIENGDALLEELEIADDDE